MTGGDHSTGFIGPPYLRSGEITPDDLILHNTDNNIAPYYMLTQCHWTRVTDPITGHTPVSGRFYFDAEMRRAP